MKPTMGCSAAVALFLLSSTPSHAAQLLMTDHRACLYCRQFNREVGKVYAETEAGQLAPLRRVSRMKKWPADLAGITPAYHTPVFILVDEGREIGRFAGYAGGERFWQQLNPLLAKLQEPTLEQLQEPTSDQLPDLQVQGRAGLF